MLPARPQEPGSAFTVQGLRGYWTDLEWTGLTALGKMASDRHTPKRAMLIGNGEH